MKDMKFNLARTGEKNKASLEELHYMILNTTKPNKTPFLIVNLGLKIKIN